MLFSNDIQYCNTSFSFSSSCIFDWISAFFKTRNAVSRLEELLNEQKNLHPTSMVWYRVQQYVAYGISGPSNFVDIIIWIDSQSDMPIRSIQRYLKGLSLRYLLWQEPLQKKAPLYVCNFFVPFKRFTGFLSTWHYPVSIFWWFNSKCEHFLVLLNLQFKMVSYQHTNLGMNANESSRKKWRQKSH